MGHLVQPSCRSRVTYSKQWCSSVRKRVSKWGEEEMSVPSCWSRLGRLEWLQVGRETGGDGSCPLRWPAVVSAAHGPVPCPVVPDLEWDIPAAFLILLLLGLLRHAQCTILLAHQAFTWECIAVTSRSWSRCRQSPGTHLEQLCSWQSPVSPQQTDPAAFGPGWSAQSLSWARI